ncbi:MAG: glycosyltransferase family 39 protein [Chloroflexi bacterium]|nr:glycosyltransferase family 39 protein [Chloroflexota bacterium]
MKHSETDGSPHGETPLPGELVPVIERPDLSPSSSSFGLLVTLAGVSFVTHMLVAGNYGYFRDELYYIADGQHLQAGYVDQPLLMGWLAALMRVVAGDSLVAIHVIPALACALIIVITGLMARELGGGRVAQLVAGVAALFTLDFMATGSLFSMDVLDQLWWALASLILIRLLRRNRNMNAPRLWLLMGLVMAMALLTKLTVLYFGAALVLALLVTPERRYLRTPWPWLAGGIAFVGLLPYLIWNALNGWPTLEFWHNYGVRSGPLDFFSAQVSQMNPIALPLAVAGLVFYFRSAGAQYRLLGWVFVFAYLILTLLGTKAYFLAPAYPILFAAGALVFERLRLRPWLGWIKPAYVTLLALVGVLLAPAIMPILTPATTVATYGPLAQPLSDRFGWDSLTQTVEQVYDALPPQQRAQACVLTSNYGEAGALQQLAAPGRLPPVISGHNNYYLWGPGSCTGQVLIAVGYSPADFQGPPTHYAHITLAATERCEYCIAYENNLPITVVSGPTESNPIRLWPSVKHYE